MIIAVCWRAIQTFLFPRGARHSRAFFFIFITSTFTAVSPQPRGPGTSCPFSGGSRGEGPVLRPRTCWSLYSRLHPCAIFKCFCPCESEEAESHFGVGANSFVNNSMAECSKINCCGLTAGRDPRGHVVLQHRCFAFSLVVSEPPRRDTVSSWMRYPTGRGLVT